MHTDGQTMRRNWFAWLRLAGKELPLFGQPPK